MTNEEVVQLIRETTRRGMWSSGALVVLGAATIPKCGWLVFAIMSAFATFTFLVFFTGYWKYRKSNIHTLANKGL